MVPPPGRLSTTMVWPSCLESCSRTIRATMSFALPAANGMIAVMVRPGHVCANAEATVMTDRRAMAAARSLGCSNPDACFMLALLLLRSSEPELAHQRAPFLALRREIFLRLFDGRRIKRQQPDIGSTLRHFPR